MTVVMLHDTTPLRRCISPFIIHTRVSQLDHLNVEVKMYPLFNQKSFKLKP